MYNYFSNLLIVTIFFVIHVELSVGGIFYRVNVDGNKSFQVYSLLSYMVNPLTSKFLWAPKLLDVNYVFIVIMYSVIYLNLKRIMYRNQDYYGDNTESSVFTE